VCGKPLLWSECVYFEHLHMYVNLILSYLKSLPQQSVSMFHLRGIIRWLMIPLGWNRLLWQPFLVRRLFLLYLYDIEHSFWHCVNQTTFICKFTFGVSGRSCRSKCLSPRRLYSFWKLMTLMRKEWVHRKLWVFYWYSSFLPQGWQFGLGITYDQALFYK
jgi:hypothetical protein